REIAARLGRDGGRAEVLDVGDLRGALRYGRGSSPRDGLDARVVERDGLVERAKTLDAGHQDHELDVFGVAAVHAREVGDDLPDRLHPVLQIFERRIDGEEREFEANAIDAHAALDVR